MAELSAFLLTLCLFLLWRLYVVSMRLRVAHIMLRGMISGKVSVVQTDDTIELEIKRNV